MQGDNKKKKKKINNTSIDRLIRNTDVHCSTNIRISIRVIFLFAEKSPRVVGPYTLSNLCQRLKSSLPH